MPDPPPEPQPSGLTSLVEELRRRRVFRVAGIYLVAGASFLQGAGAVLENLNAPPFLARWLTVIVIAGFPIAVAASWAYDMRLHRERTGGVQHRWSTPQARAVFAAGVVAGMVVLAAIARGAGSWRAAAVERTPAAVAAMPEVAVLAPEPLGGSTEAAALARSIQGLLSDALAQSDGLRVRSRDVMDSYAHLHLPLDSLAVRLGLHYLVSTAVRTSDQQTELVVRVLDSSGRVVASPATFIAGTASVDAVEQLMERASDFVLRTLGSELRAAEWRLGTRSDRALELVNAADLATAQALGFIGDTALARPPADSDAHDAQTAAVRALLMEADALLERAMATDPDWDTPVLRRATLALRISHVMEAPEAIEQVIDRAITMLDQLIARRGTHARALALRGRLRFWKTLEFPDPALLRRAEADLHTALQQDAGMANAAGWLSDVFYSEANFHQARTWSERALQLDAYQLGATRIRHRLAMATFETGRDTAALRICREALDRFVDIPDNHGCVLEVLAFGDVAPDVSAAWQHLARLKATADGNQPGTSAYYEAATAAVIARAGLTDSAEHVLQRARARNAAAFGADGHLLWLEAAVRFRMGQTDTAAALLRSFMARGHPATDVILARRAVKPYLFTLYGDRPT